MTTDPAVAAVESVDVRELVVRFADGVMARCNRFWLRDNCPSNGDRTSLFRPFTVASMADDLAIEGAEVLPDGVRVTFSDGAADVFPSALLHACVLADHDEQPGWTPWATGDVPDTFEFVEIGVDGHVHHRLLEAVHRSGFALVAGVPDGPDATDTMAGWLRPIRETDFGRVFDIVTEPDPFTPSQSEAALDPHTDDPYRYTPAGISILQCVSPCSGEGGASTIVDGFAIAETIRATDPSAFDVLTVVPVPYVHRRSESVEQGAAVHLEASSPIISLDGSGDVCGIRFHERSMGLVHLDPDLTDEFYRALITFGRHVLGGAFAYERRLAAGEAIVYDNQRVLHGRSAITGGNTRRHLRLLTVDRDQVHSRLRRLRAAHAPGTEHAPLTEGCR